MSISNTTFVLPGYQKDSVGGYRVVYDYANRHAQQGRAVSILQSHSLPGAPRRSPFVTAWGIKEDIRANRRPAWFDLREEVKLVNRARLSVTDLHGADVVVATSAETAPIVAKAVSKSGAVGVYFIQHYETWIGREFVDETWRLPLRKIVIADWLADVGKRLGVSTSLVQNGVSAEDFPLGPPTAERPVDVLAMVSPVQRKRTDLVVEAFRELAGRSAFEGATFGVSSRPDGLPRGVQHWQNPSRAELSSLYQKSKVYLCASDAEGWHLPPAEAMSSGAAVISTSIDGVKAYADGVASFVPIGDGPALVEAAARLLSDTRECQRLATAGYEQIEKFRPDRAYREFARVCGFL